MPLHLFEPNLLLIGQFERYFVLGVIHVENVELSMYLIEFLKQNIEEENVLKRICWTSKYSEPRDPTYSEY